MTPKFRAWHEKEKKLYHVEENWFLTFAGDGSWSIERQNKTHSQFLVEVVNSDNGSLMQSTGREDMCGNEIFEGDIIQKNVPCSCTGKMKYLYVVKYGIDGFGKTVGFTGMPVGEAKVNTNNEPLFIINSRHDCEVIGNIHENPEYLKLKRKAAIVKTERKCKACGKPIICSDKRRVYCSKHKFAWRNGHYEKKGL